jgi:hypothetical protein
MTRSVPGSRKAIWMPAEWTAAAMTIPRVSTTRCRFRPFTFLNASLPCGPPRSVVLRHFLSGGGQARTVSVVDVEAVLGPKSLENKPLLLHPTLALPGKLSGTYTELSAAVEIVPVLTL